MSSPLPSVLPNYEVTASDVNRLSRGIRSGLGLILRHVLHTPPSAGVHQGTVLHGLEVTDITPAGGPPRVRVSKGAAMAPQGNGLNSYRLLILDGDVEVQLASTAPGTPRTDVIQLQPDTQSFSEPRLAQNIAPSGARQGQSLNRVTQERQVGIAAVRQSANAAVPGTVLLARVTVEDQGVTDVSDQRSFALYETGSNGVVGDPIRGVWGWAAHVGSTVRTLLDRVNAVFADSDRAIRVGGPDATDANAYPAVNDADGLLVNLANIPRAIALVRHRENGSLVARYAGQNIASVTVVGAGLFRVQFAASLFADNPVGGIDSGAWVVLGFPEGVVNPIAGGEASTTVVDVQVRRYAVSPSDTVEVTVREWNGAADDWDPTHQGFALFLYGPLGEGAWSDAGVGWTEV